MRRLGIIFILFGYSVQIFGAFASFTNQWTWAKSTGPVAKYEVWMQKTDASQVWALAQEVDAAPGEVVITSQPGDKYRIKVRGKDATGNVGPFSEESDWLEIAQSEITKPGKPFVKSFTISGTVP